MIFFKDAAQLKRVLPDGSKELRDDGDEICPLFARYFWSREITKTIAKETWLRYIDSGGNYHELPSLEAQDELLNLRQCPARLVDVEMNGNVATNIGKSLVDDTAADSDDWDIKYAVRPDEVKRVDIKQRFRYFQKSCRAKRRRMPDTVAEAVELGNELVKQVCNRSAQAANNATPVALSSEGFEVVSLSASSEKARGEAVSAKAELDALCAADELAKKEHNVVFAKIREEHQDEVEAWKATASQSKRTLAELREETSVTASKLRSKCESAAALHHKLFPSIHLVVKACEERKDKAADTLDELRKFTTMGVWIRWKRTWRNGVSFGSKWRLRGMTWKVRTWNCRPCRVLSRRRRDCGRT